MGPQPQLDFRFPFIKSGWATLRHPVALFLNPRAFDLIAPRKRNLAIACASGATIAHFDDDATSPGSILFCASGLKACAQSRNTMPARFDIPTNSNCWAQGENGVGHGFQFSEVVVAQKVESSVGIEVDELKASALGFRVSASCFKNPIQFRCTSETQC